jgi:hypothetical protein
MESLQRNRDPDEEDRQTLELLERLGHIEELLRIYLEQAQQEPKRDSIASSQKSRDQTPVPPPPPLQRLSVSTSDSDDSVHRLRRFLGDLAHQIENDYDRSSQRGRMSMPPLPLPTTARPSVSRQRAEDVLQTLDINISPPPPALPQSEIPRIEPFNFLYGDSVIGGGERPRSASPMSIDKLPALRHVASVVLPMPLPVSAPAPKRRRRRIEEREGGQETRRLPAVTPNVERLLNKRRIGRDISSMKRPEQQRQNQETQLQQPQQQRQQQTQQPARQVVLRPALKVPNAVPQVSVNPCFVFSRFSFMVFYVEISTPDSIT